MSYEQKDRDFGDSFMPEVKAILGQFLLKDDFSEEDMKRNTDLIILKMETKRIGVRIRRYSAYKNEDWRKQFTIRFQRASGCETEFQKIMDGWGDYFFYGFSDESGEHLIAWFIGDFTVFRDRISKLLYDHGGEVFEANNRVMENVDRNGSKFIWFWKDEIPDFVIASSDTWPHTWQICNRTKPESMRRCG